MNIINYENFFKSLPQPFQQNNATKQCCYFNKKVQSPSTKINTPTAFSKLSEVVPHGSKMSNSTIESYDFELWEFSGNETYLFKDNSTA
ncbi:hypothetical protein FACS1894207_0560 [Bacteroidia bacterium]|nr:hypothetical protein FACS1894207_0560 [Bacteroidia bacterium]